MPDWVGRYVGLLAPAIKFPLKYHWLPVAVLEVRLLFGSNVMTGVGTVITVTIMLSEEVVIALPVVFTKYVPLEVTDNVLNVAPLIAVLFLYH